MGRDSHVNLPEVPDGMRRHSKVEGMPCLPEGISRRMECQEQGEDEVISPRVCSKEQGSYLCQAQGMA